MISTRDLSQSRPSRITVLAVLVAIICVSACPSTPSSRVKRDVLAPRLPRLPVARLFDLPVPPSNASSSFSIDSDPPYLSGPGGVGKSADSFFVNVPENSSKGGARISAAAVLRLDRSGRIIARYLTPRWTDMYNGNAPVSASAGRLFAAIPGQRDVMVWSISHPSSHVKVSLPPTVSVEWIQDLWGLDSGGCYAVVAQTPRPRIGTPVAMFLYRFSPAGEAQRVPVLGLDGDYWGLLNHLFITSKGRIFVTKLNRSRRNSSLEEIDTRGRTLHHYLLSSPTGRTVYDWQPAGTDAGGSVYLTSRLVQNGRMNGDILCVRMSESGHEEFLGVFREPGRSFLAISVRDTGYHFDEHGEIYFLFSHPARTRKNVPTIAVYYSVGAVRARLKR